MSKNVNMIIIYSTEKSDGKFDVAELRYALSDEALELAEQENYETPEAQAKLKETIKAITGNVADGEVSVVVNPKITESFPTVH